MSCGYGASLARRGASPAEKRRAAITIGWSGDGGRPQARDSPGGELWDGAGRAAEKAAAKEPEGREAGRQEQLAQAQDGVQLVQQLELRQRMRMPGGGLVVRLVRVRMDNRHAIHDVDVGETDDAPHVRDEQDGKQNSQEWP